MILAISAASTEREIFVWMRFNARFLTEENISEEIATQTINIAVPARNGILLLSTTTLVRVLVIRGVIMPINTTASVRIRKTTTSATEIQSFM